MFSTIGLNLGRMGPKIGDRPDFHRYGAFHTTFITPGKSSGRDLLWISKYGRVSRGFSSRRRWLRVVDWTAFNSVNRTFVPPGHLLAAAAGGGAALAGHAISPHSPLWARAIRTFQAIRLHPHSTYFTDNSVLILNRSDPLSARPGPRASLHCQNAPKTLPERAAPLVAVEQGRLAVSPATLDIRENTYWNCDLTGTELS